MNFFMISMEPKIFIKQKEPEQLGEILKSFQENCNPDYLQEVFKNRDLYSRKELNIELLASVNYYSNQNKIDPSVYNAYLGFMGICFYYFDKNLTNEAWYYFSRAEYFKGIYESWNNILEQIEIIDLLKQEKRDAAKELSPLDMEISKALQEIIANPSRKPALGWVDKSVLINEAKSDIFKIMQNSNARIRITDSAVQKRVSKLLREDKKLNDIFTKNLKTIK